MALRALSHPRMVSGLKNFYPHTCTIQVNTPAKSNAGQKVPSWNNLADHVEIPCRFSAGGGSEVRQLRQTFAVKTPAIALQGYYPEITEKMRAVVDGQAYNILNPRHDAQHESTSLDVELVS